MKPTQNERSRKKMAAALTAVAYHIHSEQEILASQSAMPTAMFPERTPPALPAKLWGVAGRQDQMQMRMQMQLKAFHGYQKRTA